MLNCGAALAVTRAAAGGKGRGDRLMVIPTRYPMYSDPYGYHLYSEELAKAEMED